MQVGLLMLGVCLLTMAVPSGLAQAASQGDTKATVTQAEQDIVTLSKDKWRWMAERNVEALDKLFAPEAIFVHMGATMSKSQELEVIKSGTIQYKDAQIQEVSVRFVGGTAILAQQDPPRRGGRRQRSRQSVQRDRGLREGRRGVEARRGFVHPFAHPAVTAKGSAST